LTIGQVQRIDAITMMVAWSISTCDDRCAHRRTVGHGRPRHAPGPDGFGPMIRNPSRPYKKSSAIV
jgi:hypothetical protein